MGLLDDLRRATATVDRWFRDHVALWWLLLATVPGGAYAGFHLVIDGGSPWQATLLGAVFGVVFATITVVLQRQVGGGGQSGPSDR